VRKEVLKFLKNLYEAGFLIPLQKCDVRSAVACCVSMAALQEIRNRNRMLSSRGGCSFRVSERYNLGNITTHWILLTCIV
jgi:hypothetical protein